MPVKWGDKVSDVKKSSGCEQMIIMEMLSLDASPWGPTKYSASNFQGNGRRFLSKFDVPNTYFIYLQNDIGERGEE